MEIEYINPKELVIPDVRVTNYFTEEGRRELVESIRETGIREPINVIRENGTRHVVDGFNRAMAAVELGLPLVPCVVKDGTLQDVLVENLQTATQRGTYRYSEVRRVIATLADEMGLDSDAIVKKTGMSRERVENLMWVNSGIPAVQEALDAGELPLGQAVAICRWADPDDQAMLFALYFHHRPNMTQFAAMVDAYRQRRAIEPPTQGLGAAATDPHKQPTAACNNCELQTPVNRLMPFMLCPSCYGATWAALRNEKAAMDA